MFLVVDASLTVQINGKVEDLIGICQIANARAT